MAEVLLCTREDIMTRTSLSGNIDMDKITPFIKTAQDIHVQSMLGTKLYDKILEDIGDDDLTATYEALVVNYVKPVLIHYAVADFLAFHAYSVENGGIYKHTSDSGEVVSKAEVDRLVQKQRDIGDHYRDFLVKHLSLNNDLYPEFNDYQAEGMYPTGSNNGFTGWVL